MNNDPRKVGYPAPLTNEQMEDMSHRRSTLRPNVTPVTPGPLGLVPLLLIALAAVPWFIGVWQIVRWIWR